MFSKDSRYVDLATVETEDRHGRKVTAVKLRRLPAPRGVEFTVAESDQLDVLSAQRYRNATRFWHIADANSELAANALVGDANRTIKLPER